MHRLERRLAKLEPRAIRDEGVSNDAKEILLERHRRITARLSDCPADERYRPSLAEIVAGAPCSDADLERLRDFFREFKSSR